MNPEVPTKFYRKERPHDLWTRSYHLRLSPTFPMFGQTNIGARLMAYPKNSANVSISIQCPKGMSRCGTIQGGVFEEPELISIESLNMQFKPKSMALIIPIIYTTILVKWNSLLKELVKRTQNDTQHQNNTQLKTDTIDCDGVQLTYAKCHMAPLSTIWYIEYWTI